MAVLSRPATAQDQPDAEPGIVLEAQQPTPEAASEAVADMKTDPAERPGGARRSPARRAAAPPAQAATPAAAAAAASSPRAACLDAVRTAEAEHGLPEGLLVAIALNESGLHAYALSVRGRAHFPDTREEAERLYRSARGPVMAGCVQVNAGVHARGADWPLDPHHAADWAGRFLRDAYARTGSWAETVRIWHGGRPGSATRLACRIRAKLDVTAPHSGLFTELGCAEGATVARLRRNGETHLQIAQADER